MNNNNAGARPDVVMSLLSPEVEATYEILQKLGAGGMGAVYHVRHRTFGELAVIKVMQARLQEYAVLRERFEREAKKGKQLDHPHIARVMNYFVGANGNAHLVMEYIDGVDLRDVIQTRSQPLDPTTVATIGLQVLSALAHVHAHRIVHRDISPDNLMLTKDAAGEQMVKLIDLGIAKSLDESQVLTEYGRFIGKAQYGSPEQFGDNVDARSDLYSVGVVLYELLTKALPITGTSFNALALAHCNVAPRSFAESDPQGRVPENLRRVILKALEKKPARRHQTADEFASALRATLAPAVTPTIAIDDVMPPPPPAATTVPNPAVSTIRKPWKARVITAATVVVVTAAVLMSMIDRDGGRTVLIEPPPVELERGSGTDVTVSASLTPELETKLDPIVRDIISKGRPLAKEEPGIAGFLTDNALSYDKVQPTVVRIAAKVRSSTDAIDRGKKLAAAGDVRGAYEAFAVATRMDPDSAFAWSNFGAAAALLNKPDEAMQAYEQALARDPSNWLAHYNFACHLARSGRRKDAIREVDMAVTHLRAQSAPGNVESILKSMRSDEALKTLRDDPDFRQIVSAR